MDNKTAAILIESLMERIERDQTIGSVSSLERRALLLALAALQGSSATQAPLAIEPVAPATGTPATAEVVETATPTASGPVASAIIEVKAAEPVQAASLPEITLALTAIERDEVTDPEVLLCLDFGTAMSKAFATVFPDKYLDLELGTEAGRQGYTLPSSVFIGDDGKAYFGFEAIEMSQDLSLIHI